MSWHLSTPLNSPRCSACPSAQSSCEQSAALGCCLRVPCFSINACCGGGTTLCRSGSLSKVLTPPLLAPWIPTEGRLTSALRWRTRLLCSSSPGRLPGALQRPGKLEGRQWPACSPYHADNLIGGRQASLVVLQQAFRASIAGVPLPCLLALRFAKYDCGPFRYAHRVLAA